jgi:cell wall assembly regulator SMI1
MSDDLKETEARIDRFLAWIKAEKSFPKFVLYPPATEDQLAEVEALFGQALPADVKALYRRFNGEASRDFTSEEFFDGAVFGHVIESLELVMSSWLIDWDLFDSGYGNVLPAALEDHNSLKNPKQQVPSFISLIGDGGGSYVGIDLGPQADGSWGQVILLERDDRFFDGGIDPKKVVVAASLTAFLGWLVEALESDRFVDAVLRAEMAEALVEANGEPLYESGWAQAGFGIDHLHELILEELSKGQLLGPAIPSSPFDLPSDNLLNASAPVMPDPKQENGIARSGLRRWKQRPIPRAQRPPFVPDGTLPSKIQGLVDQFPESRSRFEDGPFVIELTGQSESWSQLIGQLVAPGVVQQIYLVFDGATSDPFAALFEALGFTSAFLPRTPSGSRSGRIRIVVNKNAIEWTVTDPDNMPTDQEIWDSSGLLASFSTIFGEVTEIREDPDNPLIGPAEPYAPYTEDT